MCCAISSNRRKINSIQSRVSGSRMNLKGTKNVRATAVGKVIRSLIVCCARLDNDKNRFKSVVTG